MQPPTILLVSPDPTHAARLQAALTTTSALRLVGDVRHSAEATREAVRLRPAAIVLAADLPGRLLVPLVGDLRAASDASKVIVIGARVTLDGAMLRALFDLGATGCLAWEDASPEALPHYLTTVLAGGLVTSPGLLPALLDAHERRRGGRMEGLALTPWERALARGRADRTHVALWVHDPALAASVGFHVAQAGLTLALVDTAGALLDVALGSVALVVDCAAVPDALDRCLAIVPWVTCPVLICHPDEGFVADLRLHTTSELMWLPPAWLGTRLRDKLRLLDDASVSAARGSPAHRPLTEREREVLGLVGAGQTTREIAMHLGLSRSTVKSHKTNALRKLEVGEYVDTDAASETDEGPSPKGRED